MNSMKRIILIIFAFSLVLLPACHRRHRGSANPTPAFVYVLPTLSTQTISLFEVDPSTGLLASSPTTAYSSSTQTYQQITFAVVNGVRYAYVADPGNQVVYQCTIGTSGLFNMCSSLLAPPGWTPYAIAFATVNNVQYAYVNDGSNGDLYQCNLNPDGSFSSCSAATPQTFPAPYGITFATVNGTQYAYLADAGMGGAGNYGNVYQCQLNSNGSFVVPCVDTITIAPQWIPYAVAFTSVAGTQYAYVSDNGTSTGNGNVYVCQLNPADGLFTQCDPASSTPLWNPYFIAFATLNGQQYAYVADVIGSLGGGMYRCVLANSGAGALSNCLPTPTFPPSPWRPVGIAF